MSLFTLNITKIYDKVIYRQFIHILKVKRILKNIANQIYLFMMNRIITLIIKNYKIKKALISIEILQRLLLSLILYLFYAVELLEVYNNISKRLSVSEFINDINLLIYKLFMKYNYRILIKAHNKCLNWTKYYKTFFNSGKYELIYLSRISRKFNMKATLQVENKILIFKLLIRVLGIRMNPQLRWEKHVKKVTDKMKIQTNTLT